MGRMTVKVDDKVEAKFRSAAAEKFKSRKGYLKAAMAEAVNNWLEEKGRK
ncbi:hypothetical protein HYV82_06295 [Candidatus Woesearchaeota archaeon]|nr:hypothetical protein [Candidatus Woesearchaeota archaeon]